jgi:hypothetical protein
LTYSCHIELAPKYPFRLKEMAGRSYSWAAQRDQEGCDPPRQCTLKTCSALAQYYAGALENHKTRGDKQVQRALRAAIRNVHRKCLLASAHGAEVRHVPIESRQPQEDFHKARCLPKRHPEQYLHCQTGLNRCVTECPRPTPSYRKVRHPSSSRDQTRSPVTRGDLAPRCKQPSSLSYS